MRKIWTQNQSALLLQNNHGNLDHNVWLKALLSFSTIMFKILINNFHTLVNGILLHPGYNGQNNNTNIMYGHNRQTNLMDGEVSLLALGLYISRDLIVKKHREFTIEKSLKPNEPLDYEDQQMWYNCVSMMAEIVSNTPQRLTSSQIPHNDQNFF